MVCWFNHLLMEELWLLLAQHSLVTLPYKLRTCAFTSSVAWYSPPRQPHPLCSFQLFIPPVYGLGVCAWWHGGWGDVCVPVTALDQALSCENPIKANYMFLQSVWG